MSRITYRWRRIITKSVQISTHVVEQDSFHFLTSIGIWITLLNTQEDQPVPRQIPLVDLWLLPDKMGLATEACTALREMSGCVTYKALAVFL